VQLQGIVFQEFRLSTKFGSARAFQKYLLWIQRIAAATRFNAVWILDSVRHSSADRA